MNNEFNPNVVTPGPDPCVVLLYEGSLMSSLSLTSSPSDFVLCYWTLLVAVMLIMTCHATSF